ncbi:hypothetical protein CGMCC3_g10950 [Colletotrichum fructicola]|nr:uncharacterized protein CGMCC3_g17388 [Colletotrichum fructicola]XP_031882626.1 uncharacterized protein CGMCC3_g10950 [Colletotrichum fructicola]KAE9566453.1 hypothetical protein CGMCC3_g17388 [Colletotrichum fructicola]KAE9573079.1 hypothetical protein CGMCC3_g10950 [Colletotrichum fructicola]
MTTTYTLPTAVASATTRTASLLTHDHNDDDVIYLGSRIVPKTPSRLRQPTRPPPLPTKNKRRPPRQVSKKKSKSTPKPSHRGSVRRLSSSPAEYAQVGRIRSSGNKWHDVYGSANRSNRELCYWSESAPNTCLSPADVRKKFQDKMQSARGKDGQDGE